MHQNDGEKTQFEACGGASSSRAHPLSLSVSASLYAFKQRSAEAGLGDYSGLFNWAKWAKWAKRKAFFGGMGLWCWRKNSSARDGEGYAAIFWARDSAKRNGENVCLQHVLLLRQILWGCHFMRFGEIYSTLLEKLVPTLPVCRGQSVLSVQAAQLVLVTELFFRFFDEKVRWSDELKIHSSS